MQSESAPIAQDLDITKLRQERDLYRQLLELGMRAEIQPFLDDALSLITQLSGARRGYLELLDDRAPGAPPRFWIAKGCYDEDVEAIRTAISRGIIAEAIATGQTVVTESALQDPRFGKRGSVLRNRTEAVLCAPIGTPPLGVVYLQDRNEPGPFSEEDRALLEIFARHLVAFADRLMLRRASEEQQDPTLPFRKALRVEGIVGRSAALAKLLEQVSLVAPLEVSVLITGPSGTGKTQLARAIHDNGPRSGCPFVELNCAALPETLVESELFGALPGAHSMANKRIEGKVAAAQGGTLFLDEIGDLHPLAQAKLLQLLQSREYYPLGSAKPMRADVRVIAATNADLRAAVARKAFREDLLYRLEVLPIRVPSLAERPGDIAELAEYYCIRACQTHRFPRLRLSAAAVRALEAAEWPGNVRELAHKVEAAAIRAAREPVAQVERRHLFPESITEDKDRPRKLTFQQATRQFQEQFLSGALEEAGWNVNECASALELSRSHVYNLIAAFGLERRRP